METIRAIHQAVADGGAVSEVCAEHAIAPSTYYRKRAQLEPVATRALRAAGELVEVPAGQSPDAVRGVQMVIAGLPIADVARRLEVAPSTVYRWLSAPSVLAQLESACVVEQRVRYLRANEFLDRLQRIASGDAEMEVEIDGVPMTVRPTFKVQVDAARTALTFIRDSSAGSAQPGTVVNVSAQAQASAGGVGLGACIDVLRSEGVEFPEQVIEALEAG